MPDVGIVLLAAGGSTRMGRPKQLLPIAGQSMLRHAAGAAVGSGCMPVVVVLGAGAESLQNELSGLPVTIAVNDIWQRGLGGSIRCGMRALLGSGTRVARNVSVHLTSPSTTSPQAFGPPAMHESRTPSPGTPGEGGGEGLLQFLPNPHPSPLPEYRARGPEGGPAGLHLSDWCRGQGSEADPTRLFLSKQYREKGGIAAHAADSIVTAAGSPDAALILLGDQPFVTADVIRRLVSTHARCGKPICVSAFNGTFGPPVIVGSQYFNLLLALPDDRGAKAVWAGRHDQVHFEPCPEASIDIDTPADYQRWSNGPAAP